MRGVFASDPEAPLVMHRCTVSLGRPGPEPRPKSWNPFAVDAGLLGVRGACPRVCVGQISRWGVHSIFSTSLLLLLLYLLPLFREFVHDTWFGLAGFIFVQERFSECRAQDTSELRRRGFLHEDTLVRNRTSVFSSMSLHRSAAQANPNKVSRRLRLRGRPGLW